MQKITFKKIKQFVEGNLNKLEDDLIGKPEYYKEQIIYRASKCSDCYEKGECSVCGCALPAKHYVAESCNDGERFPDLMNEEDWEAYKKEHDIKVTIE